jgi:hypothetical protein
MIRKLIAIPFPTYAVEWTMDNEQEIAEFVAPYKTKVDDRRHVKNGSTIYILDEKGAIVISLWGGGFICKQEDRIFTRKHSQIREYYYEVPLKEAEFMIGPSSTEEEISAELGVSCFIRQQEPLEVQGFDRVHVVVSTGMSLLRCNYGDTITIDLNGALNIKGDDR